MAKTRKRRNTKHKSELDQALDALTDKQRAFVLNYTTPGTLLFGNKFRSAIEAGYAESTAIVACRDISDNPRIEKAVELVRVKMEEDCRISRAECIANARDAIAIGRERGAAKDIVAGNQQLIAMGGYGSENRQESSRSPSIHFNFHPGSLQGKQQAKQVASRVIESLPDDTGDSAPIEEE